MKNKITKEHSHKYLVFKKLCSNKLLLIFGILTFVIVIAGILAPVVSPYSPYDMQTSLRLKAPSAAHWFGTDTYGRDVLTRVLYGIRMSLVVGILTAVISTVIGIILGLLAGYFNWLDTIIMRISEAMSTIPVFLMAITLMTILGISTKNVIISMSIVYIPLVVTVTRGVALQVREQTYIEAIRSIGAKWPRILFRHMMPNVLSPVIVQATYIFASSMLVEAALSFLSCGIPLPAPSLGNILSEARTVIFSSWWLVTFPGICLIIVILGINILGDALRDLMDPLSN